MNRSTQKIWWATPPTFVGLLMVLAVIVAAALQAIFVQKGMIDEAILACLGAAVLLLVGVLQLLAELIAIGRRIEKSLESKPQ